MPLIQPKIYAAVTAALTRDSTADGYIFVPDSQLFLVGATVKLSGTALPSVYVKLLEIVDRNKMAVRLNTVQSTSISWARSDVSAYTLAAASVVEMAEQTSETEPVKVAIDRQTNIFKTDGSSSPQPVLINSDKNVDAFGRLIVAQPEAIFDSKLLVDNQGLFWDDQQTSGSGTTSTYNTNQSSVSLGVSSSTAGTRVRQTFQRFIYQAGKSQGVLATGILGTPATGITRRLGVFDSQNGLFFESSPSAVRVVRRTFTSGSAVDSAVNQANWNIDKMDGTGISGISLDFSRVQIFAFQFQWLGAGSMWFGFDVNGTIYWAHKINSANSLTTVSMSTPNLPMRFEISNSGTGAASSMLQICCSVFSGGNVNRTGSERAIYRNTALSTLNNNSWYPLISIRLGSLFFGTRVKLTKAVVVCHSVADFTWRLVLNPTVVGTALSFGALSNSAIEAAFANTSATTITGGTDIDAGVSQSSIGQAETSDLGYIRLGSSIAGVSDILVLAVRRDTGNTENFMASITIHEQN